MMQILYWALAFRTSKTGMQPSSTALRKKTLSALANIYEHAKTRLAFVPHGSACGTNTLKLALSHNSSNWKASDPTYKTFYPFRNVGYAACFEIVAPAWNNNTSFVQPILRVFPLALSLSQTQSENHFQIFLEFSSTTSSEL